MISYFSSIVSNLNLKPNLISNSEKLNYIVKTFENHQSVQKIKVANSDEMKAFDFSYVTEEESGNGILNLSICHPKNKLAKMTYQQRFWKTVVTYIVENWLL